MLQCTENCGIYQRKTVIHHIQSSPYNPLIKGGTSQCPFGILRMYIFILIIYIEVTRKRRDYTFIPTSLFRDFSLIRGFYCQEYKNIHNHHLHTLQICILGMVVNLNALFSCYTVTLCFYGSMTKYPSIKPPLHIKKHLKNIDTGTICIMNHQQLTK